MGSATPAIFLLFSILVATHVVVAASQNQREWLKHFKPKPKPIPSPKFIHHRPVEWPEPLKPIPKDPPSVCASQFALANTACSRLSYQPVPTPSPALPLDRSAQAHRARGRRSHHHRHSHGGRGHGGEMDQYDHSGHGRGHRHRRHRHHHIHRHSVTPVETECCRWLREIDSYCVCEMLVYLPPFLTRPVHEYSAGVDGLCHVTYACPSRIVRV